MILCNEEELADLETTANNSRASILDYCKQALGLNTELKVLKVLSEMSRRRLKLYKNDIEVDEKMLQEGNLEPFSNHRHAIIMIRGEKLIFHFYINLYKKMDDLLHKENEEAVEYIYSNYMGSDEYSEYISRVGMNMVSKYGTLVDKPEEKLDYDYVDESICY